MKQKRYFEDWLLIEERLNNVHAIPNIFGLRYISAINKHLYKKFYGYNNSLGFKNNSFINKKYYCTTKISILFSMLKNIGKIIILCFKLLIRSRDSTNYHLHKNKFYTTGKMVILFTHTNQLLFWEKVISSFSKRDILFLIGVDPPKENINLLRKTLENFDYQFIEVKKSNFHKCLSLNEKWSLFKFLMFPLKLRSTREAIELKFVYLKYVFEASSVLSLMEVFAPNLVLVNAYEVNNFAHLFCQIVRQNGGKVVNTMNGMKNIDPRNNETNFDIWCVWGEAQRDMLIKYNKIPPEQLKVTGHLQADRIVDYEYSGLLEQKMSLPKGKKIVSIFSQPQVFAGDYREKFLTSINRFFAAHQDVVGILKPHPREDFSDYFNYIDKIENLIILGDNLSNKQLLYDLLSISNIVVTMYSTVSVEALCFKKTVISLDFTNLDNLLPIVDGKTVFKCTEYQSFYTKLEELLSNGYILSVNDVEKNIGFLDGKNYQRVIDVINEEI